MDDEILHQDDVEAVIRKVIEEASGSNVEPGSSYISLNPTGALASGSLGWAISTLEGSDLEMISNNSRVSFLNKGVYSVRINWQVPVDAEFPGRFNMSGGSSLFDIEAGIDAFRSPGEYVNDSAVWPFDIGDQIYFTIDDSWLGATLPTSGGLEVQRLI